MRDVVVIGGGLSGLSACYELEKHKIRYTVIEVKPRFGGSIISSQEHGFILDGGVFATQDTVNGASLSELGLEDSLFDVGEGYVGFKAGTESLIKAFSSKLTKGRLMRMAVSSIGRLNNRFTICMENGMMYDAKALIVAIPARFAERLFYTFVPEISERLRDYHYDTIFRVSLGYHKRDLPNPLGKLYDINYPFLFSTDYPSRVPDSDHLLIQAGVRAKPNANPDHAIQDVIRHFGWGKHPIVKQAHYWSEADPLSCYEDDYHDNMTAIKAVLPAGISLIGNDYSEAQLRHKMVARLDDRIQQGQDAAQQAITYLKARKNANT
jgi:protoporphyrinogen oxidase